MVVTVASWDLMIPGSRSLKEKRASIRSLRDRLARMNVSFAESGMNDQRDRGRVSVAFLAAHNAQADSILASVDRMVANSRNVLVTSSSVERF